MTVYEALRLYVRSMLEVYRYLPPDAPQREYVDHLMKLSRSSAEILPEYKTEHNLLTLEYITEKRPATYRICELLGISRGAASYRRSLDNAIDWLLVLGFGMDGVNWDDGKGAPAPLDAAGEKMGSRGE